MATLTGKQIANTYKELLQVSNSGSNDGIDGTVRAVSDGEGTESALQISNAAVNINGTFQLNGDSITKSAAQINNIADLTGKSGLLAGDGSSVFGRTLVAGANVTIGNADGQSGNPTIAVSLGGTEITVSALNAVEGTFSGNVTAARFVGPITGDVTGDVTGTAINAVTGDFSTKVSSVKVNGTNATFSNIVSATTFDGNLIGNVTGNVTGDLTGDVDGVNGDFSTQLSATTVIGNIGQFNAKVSSALVNATYISATDFFAGTLTFTSVSVSAYTTNTLTVLAATSLDGTLDVGDNATFDSDVTFTGASYNAVWDNSDNALEFANNAKATFGTNADFEIYHDGSNTRLHDTGTGNLLIQSNGSGVYIQKDASENLATFLTDGVATLYHDNSAKLATKSDGVDITGELQADSLDIDGNSQLDGTLTVGVDDTGYDVKFFGATSGKYMLWDESADSLILVGDVGIGLTSPQTLVHIHDSGTGGSDLLRLTTGDTGSGSSDGFKVHYESDLDICYMNLEQGDHKWYTHNGSSVSDRMTLSDAGNLSLTGDFSLKHDGAVLYFGADSEINLEHVADHGLKTNGHLNILDDKRIYVGTGNDLQLYHEASSNNSYIVESGAGSLVIKATHLYLNDAADGAMASFLLDGAATLFYDTAAKIATTSTGVSITGNVVATGELQSDSLDIDGNSQLDGTLTVGVDDTGYDVKFFGDTASAYMLWDASTDDLILGGASTLGVGTTVPDGKVHIHSASAGSVTANANADELIIENSGFAGLSILTPNDQLASIVFGDPDDNDVAGINYDHSGNSMRFVVNGGEHVRIDSNGNMIIGGTTAVTGAALTVEGPDSAAGSLNYVAAIRNSDAYSTTPASGIIFQNKYNSGGAYADAGGIEVVKENATDGEYGFGLGLHTRANGSAITEKLHITGEGLVMIGGSASSYDTTPSQAGLSLYYETDTGAATIGTYSSGGTTRLAFSTNSGAGEANAERLRIEGAGSVWTPTVSGANNNLRLGYLAGEDIESGSNYNTLIGDSAGKEITTGDGNTTVGYQAGDALTTGGYNTAIGHNAMSANQTGASAVAIGNQALATTTIGSITAVGDGAGQYHQDGVNLTAIGFRALQNSTTGAGNTAVGSAAMDATNTGGYNTAVGTNALGANTTGSLNVAVGNDCLLLSTESSSNTAVGDAASRSNTTGTTNVAIGKSALYANQTGNFNTVVGAYALDAANPSSTTTTMMNVAIGAYSGSALTTGYDNTFVGAESAQAGTITGYYNTCVGKTAGYYLSTGNNNTVMGKLAGYTNATGSSNTYIGSSCAFTAEAGGYNVAIGQSAAYYMTTGHNNVIIGNSAGVGNASQQITTAGHCIIIGDTAYAGSQTGDYQMVIGTSGTVGKGASTVFINANGGAAYQGDNSSSWTTTSDRRIKKNISDNDVGLDAINQIRIRNFEYRKPEEITDLPSHLAVNKEGVQLGVVAQEIREVLPNVVKEEETGFLSVSNDDITWHLVNAVKELSAKVKELEEKLNG